ncbi:CbiX/SirB N-terminal domain-containing protein [Niveibacterium umoris]|uniref:Sirohydrochlorin cobaltochelatase n=1 Tax=Niveibacterium umoris TaxID=1193620 RepID=A0A840BVB0_9RHOO|nr:CbiX/SirB N-terminal domain-containing protein [Niveibacterium umoris]MBB4014746.1 sirohydrochlorin cobaltochelatase [Niveibacterium umoris]
MNTAILLFAHGARDPDWARPLEKLAAAVRALRPGVAVHPCFLEFMNPDLPGAIAAAVAEGAHRIEVVPVFLAAGGHVKRDLPAMLDAARIAHPGVTIVLASVLGEAESVIAAMAAHVVGLAG